MDFLALIEFAKIAPMPALIAYLLWRQHMREDATLKAFQEGAETHRVFADAIQAMARLEEGQRRLQEKLAALELEARVKWRGQE